jgi:hypothetical protein
MHGHGIALWEIGVLFLLIFGIPGVVVGNSLRVVKQSPTEEELREKLEPALEEMFVTGYEQAMREIEEAGK